MKYQFTETGVVVGINDGTIANNYYDLYTSYYDSTYNNGLYYYHLVIWDLPYYGNFVLWWDEDSRPSDLDCQYQLDSIYNFRSILDREGNVIYGKGKDQ